MEKIVVLVKEPGKEEKVKTIDNTLESFQEIVGGYIECIPFPILGGVNIFLNASLNEEGNLMGLHPNIYLEEYRGILMGTFFVAGDGGGGECTSLTEEQIEEVKEYIEVNWYH